MKISHRKLGHMVKDLTEYKKAKKANKKLSTRTVRRIMKGGYKDKVGTDGI
jgi:hypothetical protein